MITTPEQAIAVQTRRRAAGLKGRSKAVRRWFKREYGRAVEAHGGPIEVAISVDVDGHPGRRRKVLVDLRHVLTGDFTGCRGWSEVHDPQWVNRVARRNPIVQVVFDTPDEETIKRVLASKHAIIAEAIHGSK